VVLMRGDAEVARWPLPGGRCPDLSVVDLLARLQLVARRLGLSIRLSDPPSGLLALIGLAGLAEVITSADPAGTPSPAGMTSPAGAAGCSAQDLAPVEVDRGRGEDGDQADRPDQHG
jgi:hypothetical protein